MHGCIEPLSAGPLGCGDLGGWVCWVGVGWVTASVGGLVSVVNYPNLPNMIARVHLTAQSQGLLGC